MRGLRPRRAAHSEHLFRKRSVVLKNPADREVFTHFSRAGMMAPLGMAGIADDSRDIRDFGWDSESWN
jgi:hypothetical protein